MRKKALSFLQKIRQRLFEGPRDYKQILLWIGVSISGLVLLGVLTFGILIAVISIGLPDVRDLDQLSLAQSTTLYDRDNNVLYVRYSGENREYVPYEKISPNIINAMVAIEDKNFWTHPGINVSSLIRGFLVNVLNLEVGQGGGSTITQQYIKNAYLTPEKSYIRKLKEVILSIQLEEAFDKKKIIELYLNKIFYGNTAYGIEKAAQIYFGKHASDVDLAESIILVAIPNRPRDFDPYTEGRYSRLTKNIDENLLKSRKITKEEDLEEGEIIRGLIGKSVDVGNGRQVYLLGRTDRILNNMLAQKYITKAQKDATWNEIQHMQFKEGQENLKAPHFVFYVLDQLERKYGKEIVEQGGLKVYTTLNPDMQKVAEKVIREGAEYNAKKYNAKNAGLVAMNPQNGQIMAWVGSRNYDDKEIDGKEDIIRDPLQPGSSFKPFVYAQTFYNRFGPGSPVYDTPIVFGQGKAAKNFDGSFRGTMTIRSALGQSRNIPAIKAYYAAGEQKPIIELTQKMGIHYDELSRDPNYDYGWPLAIGSAGISPLDMATGYSVFANGGTHHDPISILRVENSKGEILEEWKDNAGEQVLDPQVAFLINNILSDTSVRLSPNLTVPGQINAAKSGTSDMKDDRGAYHPRDLWTMGYTTSLVTGVWTGNNKPKTEGPISIAADGSNVAAPIWKKFMTEALKGTPSEDFPMPTGIQQVEISTASGKLPGPDTPSDQIKKEYFASFSVPTEVDSGFKTAQIDKRNRLLATPFCPPEVVKVAYYRTITDLYPREDWVQNAQNWVKAHSVIPENAAYTDVFFTDPPTEESPLCTAEGFNQKPAITITNIQNGMSVPSGGRIPVQVQVQSSLGVGRVEFYLDGQFKYRTINPPYTAEIRLPFGEEIGKHHTITAKVFDQLDYSGEQSVDIVTIPSAGSPPSSGLPM